jgi:hypothetical protein
MAMSVGSQQLETLVGMMQLEKAEWNKVKNERVDDARDKRNTLKGEAANLTQEAQALRGEAANIKATCNAVAAGIAVAAACCATIPIVGPIIAAALLLVAAVIILIGQLIAKALEDQAAAKEKQAGMKEQLAEREKEKMDEEKKKEEDHKGYVDNTTDKYLELFKAEDQNASKW